MNKTPKLIKPMYNLLIEMEIDDFSILQVRDKLLEITNRFNNKTDARKFIHRHVHHLVSRGYLVIEGAGRRKKFTKTALFHSTNFTVREEQLKPKKKTTNINSELSDELSDQQNDYIVLSKERNQYQGELSITLAEVDEYTALLSRFPDRSSLLCSLHSSAKEKAATILGKMNAIDALMSSIEQGFTESC